MLAQCCQVHFIAQGDAERFQRAGCIVLTAVEAPVNDLLDASSLQGFFNRRHRFEKDHLPDELHASCATIMGELYDSIQ